MSEAEPKVDELTARAQKRVGAQVREKWRLDELLGVGGMAAVYAATHRNGRRVAMKILHRETAMSDDSRARFLREGYVANAVGHPGAVSVIDDDVTEDGAPFFTMDLLHGETLDQRVRRKGRLEAAEVLAAMHQLLDVLSAAHGKGIVHRDIKPENVFLTTDATVKVLDFGIAHLDNQELSTRTGTQSGQSMGTPSFMPPEQARGRWEEVDARSDLWAVGATMFTLLTGHHVHEADTMNEVLLGAMSAPAKPIALYRPELPKEVCELVDRALAYDKEARWPSAAQMQLAVREAYASMNEPLGDLAREPTLTATSVQGAKVAPPAPIPMLKAPTMTTGRPTTRAADEDTPLPSEPPHEDTRRLGLAAFGLAFGVVALGVLAVASSGSGAPARTAAAPDSATRVTTAAPSRAPSDVPAPPSTGAAIVTVQPSEPSAPEPEPRVSPLPPPRPAHPRRAPAPPPSPPPPPVASAPPVAPPAPGPPPADPLNRRH